MYEYPVCDTNSLKLIIHKLYNYYFMKNKNK